MAQRRHLLLHVLAALAAPALSDNYFSWQDARGGVVRDTLYLEGGLFSILPTSAIYQYNVSGLAQFNFGSKFDRASNFTQLFSSQPQNFSDPGAKVHTNGFMIADNDEWYAFGGRAIPSYDNHTSLTGIIRDAVYQPNSAATTAQTGLTLKPDYIPDGNSTNRYITNGAGVSIPTESLGFYFGGLRTPNSTEISWNAKVNASTDPSVLVDTMLMVDTHKYGASVWSELPLPDYVPLRADAVLTWIPIGARGALVLIGGVPFPASLVGCDLSKSPQASNNADADSLMSTVSIYDIATATWSNQNTNGGSPPQLAQACGVVASAGNMHNIYVYGGYSGIDESTASDDVWILSLPSFTWIQAKAGDSAHGRFGHVCARPYPDQMMVVGGISQCGGLPLQTPAFADIFNLTSLNWTGSYDPSKWSEYAVPSLVTQKTQASPTASMSTSLSALFNTAYAGNLTLGKWYPYTSVVTSHGSSHQKWLIPVVVVIAVLAVIAGAAMIWFFCFKRGGHSTTQSTRSGRRSITAWMRGHPPAAKSVRSDDEMTQVECVEADGYFKRRPQTEIAELTGNSDSRVHSPSLSTPLHSPRGPVSPSSPGSAELGSPPMRHELPGNFVPNNSIQAHPLFPHPINGIASSVQSPLSVSSPSTEPMTPFELPLNRSDEDMLASPDDLDLNKTRSQRTNFSSNKTPKSPRIRAVQMSSDVSPDYSAATSPETAPIRVPVTPPSRPIILDANRSTTHHRNTSSLSSGLPDLSSPSPREDTRRSMHIAALPNSPDSSTTRVRTSEITVPSNAPEASSDANPNPSSPQRSSDAISNPDRRSQVDRQLRRKEIQNWAPGRSAYKENDDMYGNGRDTV